jgi:competence protein ComFC
MHGEYMGLNITPESAARQVGFWARGILSLVVPPLCVVCGEKLPPESRWLCRGCEIALALQAHPRVRVLKILGRKEMEVRYCFDYTSEISSIIAEMKYGDKPGLAAVLGGYLGVALGDRVGPETGIVPVPVHASKRRERGYNQSRLLAEHLAQSSGLGLCDILVKTRATVSQTDLARDRRLSNPSGSIAVRHHGRVGFEEVLLVDDVVTTGSTLRECARALKIAGAEEISACAVAASL